MVSADFISRIVELVLGVGLIASCILLYRFFRGGIMEQSFMIFSLGSVLFYVDKVITLLVFVDYLPNYPYTMIHLILETMFVVLFTVGFVLLYRSWIKLQRRTPQRNALPARLA